MLEVRRSLPHALTISLTLLACAPAGPAHTTTTPRRRSTPHLRIASEADALAALRASFDGLLRSPRSLDRAVRTSAATFPEGDLLPLTLAAVAYSTLPRSEASMGTLLDRAIEATEAKTGVSPLRTLDGLGDQGTYVAHLNFALGHHCRVAGRERYRDVHDALSGALQRALTASGGAPLPSYPEERWPIDSVIAIASLTLHARCLGHPPDPEHLSAHRRWTQAHGTDPTTTLPFARTDTHRPIPPRGSDLSWRIAVLATLEPSYAQELYAPYANHFWTTGALATGFAEWPDGADRADVDSGPILGGVGASASTFGIATTTLLEDHRRRELLVAQLPRGRALVERAHGATLGGLRVDARFVTGSMMGDATLFYALTR